MLGFLKKHKKIKTQVIKSFGFNKFSQFNNIKYQFNNIKYQANFGEYPKPKFQNHKL